LASRKIGKFIKAAPFFLVFKIKASVAPDRTRATSGKGFNAPADTKAGRKPGDIKKYFSGKDLPALKNCV
jgi:hypothetical protein